MVVLPDVRHIPNISTHNAATDRGKLEAALAAQSAGRLEDAERQYAAILGDAPDNADALHLLGTVRAQQGRIKEAIGLFTRAIGRLPRFAALYANRGQLLTHVAHPEVGLLDLDHALRLEPAMVEAVVWRGEALRLLGRDEEAKSCAAYALQLRANDPAALALRDAAPADPAKPPLGMAAAFGLRAEALFVANALEAAIADYDRAIRLDKDLAGVRFDRSLVHLLMGDFDEGWMGYEWRWGKVGELSPEKALGRRQWNGQTSLRGRRLLIVGEQGLGDVIQFLRYAALARRRGAAVTVQVRPELERMAQCFAGITVISGDPAADSYDEVCALLSMPRAFGTRLETIPADVPYLRTPRRLATAWGRRLGEKQRPRIGIVWAGNPLATLTALRNVPLEGLLASIPAGIDIVALQKEIAPEDAAVLAADGRARVLGTALDDLVDTMAVIGHLDLVVSVDTSVAHLAGALARPVWIMLPHVPDWRWLRDRPDSPWYPTARLIRQQQPAQWQPVLDEVAAGLGALNLTAR